MSSTIGKILKISVFGESHSDAIGVTVDGLPSGLKLDTDEILFEMKRRAPGSNALSTPRKEADFPEIKSGFWGGKTTGTPLCAVISNTNTRSGDYTPEILRPSHADFTAKERYLSFSDYRGGGHFSGRLTAPIVFAGAIAKQYLKQFGIEVFAHIKSVQNVKDNCFNSVDLDLEQARSLKTKELSVLSDEKAEEMKKVILNAKEKLDSVGGVIECAVCGLKAGIGNPLFDTLEGRISQMIFSIPAVKGIEFGAGFGISEMYGSQANDSFYTDGEKIKTKTNNNGGINGGISNGMPIIFNVAVKPTPSIAKKQQTVNYEKKENCEVEIHGRHDPCIVQRAVCVVEAAAAIVIADMYMEGKCYA